MRGSDDGFRALSVEDEVHYRVQGQTNWAVTHLGWAFGSMFGLLALTLLFQLPPVLGAAVFTLACLVPVAAIAWLVIKARRGDFRTKAAPRQRYLDATDLDDERRQQAMRRYRFRR